MITKKNNPLAHIEIVLVRPQTPENIGLAARVMKNTGLNRLTVVGAALAQKSCDVAKHARSIVEDARRVEALPEALSKSQFVFGTSRRWREHKFIYNLRDSKHLIASLAVKSNISIVFGPEDFGLSGEDMEFCDSIFYIPACDEFPSYNLASAVGIVCYELFTLMQEMRQIANFELAPRKEIETLLAYVQQALTQRSAQSHAESATTALRRILHRTHLTKSEAALLKSLIIKNMPHKTQM